MGDTFTEEEAKRRIQWWCVRGLLIADGDGARQQHMADDPREYIEAEIPSAAELARAVQ